MERNAPISTRRIASHYAWTPRGFVPRPVVELDSDGFITAVSRWEQLDSMSGVEFYPGVLIPPMTNAHCHLELSAMQGAIPGGGAGFTSFARAMGVLPRDSEGRVAAVALQDSAMWAEGVGEVGDICNGDSSFVVKQRSRIQYHSFLELFGLTASSADPMMALGRQVAQAGLSYSITPHSTYSLQKEAFGQAVAATDGPLSIHFLESPEEQALYEGKGGLGQWYADRGFPPIDFADYASPAARLVAQVPGYRRILLIHNTFVTESDIDLLQSYFGHNLTWVLCLRSNLYISGSLPPVELLRSRGVRIAIGTDSLASNTSLSLVEEIKLFPEVPLEERLGWLCSPLFASHLPGLVLLEGVDYTTMTLTPAAKTRRLA